LLDLNMELAGEAADWATVLAQAPVSFTDMLLIDWDLLPRSSPTAALEELRRACPAALVIVLISHLDARQQAALSSGADAFISKDETPERVAERLRSVAASAAVNGGKFSNDPKEDPMNKDVFEGKWKQVRGEAKVWWGKLTDDDLDKVAGKFEVFAGLLQEKYGYSREHAEEEIEKHLNEYEASLKKSMPTP
jgi:uncharacterized protein YjbJ (UPF0337 family)/CheY-like chemotaxis protein